MDNNCHFHDLVQALSYVENGGLNQVKMCTLLNFFICTSPVPKKLSKVGIPHLVISLQYMFLDKCAHLKSVSMHNVCLSGAIFTFRL